MSYVVPLDGVYRLQNVHYPEQNIGVNAYGVIVVVGRRVDSFNGHVEWNIKADNVGEFSKITIENSGHYIAAESQEVTAYGTTPYGWELSYRDVGRWVFRDPDSGAYLYMPDGAEGTKVTLLHEPIGDIGCWRFIPIRRAPN